MQAEHLEEWRGLEDNERYRTLGERFKHRGCSSLSDIRRRSWFGDCLCSLDHVLPNELLSGVDRR